MFADDEKKVKPLKKITRKRLKNIGLYYLKRFETSTDNLRFVLKRRVDKYAFANSDFDKAEAYQWIEELIEEFKKLNYVDDERYAAFKVKSYLSSGKSAKYIHGKLKQKGISDDIVEDLLEEQNYNPLSSALKIAKKKRIGPFRKDEEERRAFRQKDMVKLVQAGFDYDTVLTVLDYDSISCADEF
ncbi:MAG: RecX family transcriptional regulator [Lactobacillaceae bacterium]|nr:RecX family transcriptional regulator [Lactobacillaceae bacterium]